MASPQHVHSSKIDAWLVGVLLGSAVFGLICAEAASKAVPENRVVIYAAYLLSLLAVTALSLPTRYTITDRDLQIRSGLMRWRIALTDITEVFPTHNSMSSPAWSLDRLQIRYKRGGLEQSLCISPMDHEAFMVDLSRAEPNLLFDEMQIRRRTFEG